MDKNVQLKLGEILDQAIKREQESSRFYIDLVATLDNPRVTGLLQKLADEEKSHIQVLEDMKTSPAIMLKLDLPNNYYELGTKVKTPAIDSSMSAKDVIKLAISREQAAFNYYQEIAKAVGDGSLRKAFENLANWEYGHRSKLEHILKNL